MKNGKMRIQHQIKANFFQLNSRFHSPAACCLCICICIIWKRELAAAAAAVAVAKLAAAVAISSDDFGLLSRNLEDCNYNGGKE